MKKKIKEEVKKKEEKALIYEYQDEILGSSVVFILDPSIKSILDYFERNHISEVEIFTGGKPVGSKSIDELFWNIAERGAASTSVVKGINPNGSKYNIYIVWLRRRNIKHLVHESVHLVSYILKNKDVSINYITEELFACYVAFYSVLFITQLNKLSIAK